jgi:hypothetical protein
MSSRTIELICGLTTIALASGCYTGLHPDGAGSASGGDAGGSAGDSEGEGGDDDGDGVPVCDDAGGGKLSMRRLTRDELVHSMEAVVGSAVMEATAVTQATALIPVDSPGDLVAEFQNGHAFEHAYGMLASAQAVAAEVADDATAREAIFGSCAAQADSACAEAYLDGPGLRILKRPLDPERRQSLLDGFASEGGGIEGMQWLLARVLQAPEAVFHLELPREDCDDACREAFGGLVVVDDWSVAARLAYALTGQGPDDALLEAAAAGELRTQDDVRPHAQRLLQTPAARRQFGAVLDGWLMLKLLPDANATMAGVAGIDPEGLTEEAREELLEYAAYLVFEGEADANDLLQTPLGFPRSQRLAQLYGSEVATDGPVALEGGHGGLLLRIAPLLSGHPHTSPILRGAYVRKRLLCDEVPAPDPQTVAEGLEELENSDRTMVSTRELVEELTSPALCAGCHQLVNPIGFTLESFDPLGQWRSEEIVYDPDGSELARHEIDTRVTEAGLEDGAPDALDGPADLTAALAGSTKVRACLAERFVTHAQLRPAVGADACAIEEVEQALLDGSTVADAWIAAVVNAELFVRADEDSP